MKHFVLILSMTTGAAMASAQTPAKPASSATAAKPATATHTTSAMTLPPGVPRVHGILKTAFSLRYEDIKIGTGADAEPNKLYKVLYTGYLAADGHKFDSSDDHRRPVLDKDGKPELGPDGKPKQGDPEPLSFPQGYGRLIPGYDQGFYGMKVGGKRRLFIPWQLAYGQRGRPGPDAAHPGIPPKADLIFDIELVDVTEMPMPTRPGMGRMPIRPVPPRPGAPGAPGTAPAPGASPSSGAAPSAGSPATPGAPAGAPSPGQPATPPPAGNPATPAPPATNPSPTPQPQGTPPQSK
jgi:peptidylprolyl isomerase